MKKSNIVLSSVMIAFSSMSFADISISDTQNGAWVKVTDNGQPSANAVVSIENQPQVRSTYQTDDSGRVFIPLSLNSSRSIKYKAVTEDGNEFNRYAFHGVQKR